MSVLSAAYISRVHFLHIELFMVRKDAQRIFFSLTILQMIAAAAWIIQLIGWCGFKSAAAAASPWYYIFITVTW